MDASNWISLAAVAVTVTGGSVGYGVLKQKVEALMEKHKAAEVANAATCAALKADLKAEIKETDALLTAALVKQDGRITACEAGHVNAAQEMGGIKLSVAVLTERSGHQTAMLERIERYVAPDNGRPAPRRRAAVK